MAKVSILTALERQRLRATGRAGTRAAVSFLSPAERERLFRTGVAGPRVRGEELRSDLSSEIDARYFGSVPGGQIKDPDTGIVSQLDSLAGKRIIAKLSAERAAGQKTISLLASQKAALATTPRDFLKAGAELLSVAPATVPRVAEKVFDIQRANLNVKERELTSLGSKIEQRLGSLVQADTVFTQKLISEFNRKANLFNEEAAVFSAQVDAFNEGIESRGGVAPVVTKPVKFVEKFVAPEQPILDFGVFGLEAAQTQIEIKRRQAELKELRERPPPEQFGLEPIPDFEKFVEERIADIKTTGQEIFELASTFKSGVVPMLEISEPVKFAAQKQIERGEFLQGFRTAFSGGAAATKREIEARAKIGLGFLEAGALASGLGFTALGEPIVGGLPEGKVKFDVPFFGERELTKGGFRSALDIAGQLAFIDAVFRFPEAARGTKEFLKTGQISTKALRLDQPIIDVIEQARKRRQVEIVAREFFEPIKGTEKTRVLGVGEAKAGFFKKQPFLFEAELSKPQKLQDIFDPIKIQKRKLIVEPGLQKFLSEKAIKDFSGFPSTFVKRGDIVSRVGFRKGFARTPGVLDVDLGEVSVVVGKIRVGKPRFGSIFTDFARGKARPGRLKALLKEPEMPFSELQAIKISEDIFSEEAVKRGAFSKRFKRLLDEGGLLLPEKATQPKPLQLLTPERGLVVSKIDVPTEQFFFKGKFTAKELRKAKELEEEIAKLQKGAGVSFFPGKPSEAFTFLEIGKKGKIITIGGTEITKKAKGAKFISIAQPLKRPVTIRLRTGVKRLSKEERKLLGLDVPLLEAPELKGIFDFGKSKEIARTLEKISIRKDPFGAVTPKAVQRFFEKRAAVAAEQTAFPDLSKFLSPAAKGVGFGVPSKAATVTKQIFREFTPVTKTGTIQITKTKPARLKEKEIFGKVGQEFKRARVSEEKIMKEFQRAFGIPKEAVKVRPTIKIKQAPGLRLVSLTRPGIKQIPKEVEKEKRKLAEGLQLQEGFGISFKDAQLFLEKTAERQRQRQAELFKFAEAQRLGEAFRETTATVQKQIFKEQLIPEKPLRKLPKIPFLFPIPEKKKKKKPSIKVKQQAYSTLLKRRGEFVKVSKRGLHRNTALSLGAHLADNSASRTFRIKQTSGKPTGPRRAKPSLRKFRKPVKGGVSQRNSPLWVELTKHAIDTPGEHRQISMRGIATLRQGFFRKKKRKRGKR